MHDLMGGVLTTMWITEFQKAAVQVHVKLGDLCAFQEVYASK